ncbi:hypothetical protein CDAR_107441 [Caerostris darwini]|uniref:Uncharacterized protein n=1 Tax=Caerostris darwini TaxID=1538125 RepID=A0AAV4NBU2_9ARAC|nr:hypothetical protein CDAR_107441 [Caerostris darwini]
MLTRTTLEIPYAYGDTEHRINRLIIIATGEPPMFLMITLEIPYAQHSTEHRINRLIIIATGEPPMFLMITLEIPYAQVALFSRDSNGTRIKVWGMIKRLERLVSSSPPPPLPPERRVSGGEMGVDEEDQKEHFKGAV